LAVVTSKINHWCSYSLVLSEHLPTYFNALKMLPKTYTKVI